MELIDKLSVHKADIMRIYIFIVQHWSTRSVAREKGPLIEIGCRLEYKAMILHMMLWYRTSLAMVVYIHPSVHFDNWVLIRSLLIHNHNLNNPTLIYIYIYDLSGILTSVYYTPGFNFTYDI